MKKQHHSEFILSLARQCNLFLSLQCCVGSWIRFLTACNTLFHCMPQNQNYRPGLLQTTLDTICCHEYLIRCRRDRSKYSPSSFFFFIYFACRKPTHGNKSYLCTLWVGAVTEIYSAVITWYLFFFINSFINFDWTVLQRGKGTGVRVKPRGAWNSRL